MSTSLEDELAGGATLEAAAAALGVELRKTGLVDIEGKGLDGKPVEGLPGGEFLNTLFLRCWASRARSARLRRAAITF